ncbi:hypothetical protein Tco_1079553 [Tanacetum coccineum]|uniref:Uncharacterized protein n=1 Tax=Tanacetum coccineum TaxID=301880 RepID=A0ABQ5HS51_9ASTR
MDQHLEEPANSDLNSMLDDEVMSISSFGTDDSKEESTANKILDEITNLNASADQPSDPLGHLLAEMSSLSTRMLNLESSLA